MIRSQFMNDVNPNMHRQFAQEEFEKSLQALQNLSLIEDGASDEDEDAPICWDEVADDLELFFESLNSIETVVASTAEVSETGETELNG